MPAVTDLVRVRAHAVAELAADQRWRAKLYAGLTIGAGLVLAGLIVLVMVTELPNEHGDDYLDAVVGAFFFLAVGAGLVTFGVQRIFYARHLTRIELRAQLHPDADWIILGREVRSTDPTGAAGPPAVLHVSSRARELLMRGSR